VSWDQEGKKSVLNSKHTTKETMKNKIHSMFIGLALLAGVYPVSGQGSRFFRILGPAATQITAFRPDGTMVWTNALPDTNYTIQTISPLPVGADWVDYVQLPVTNGINTNRIVDPNPPTGLAYIPAGSFQMGDNLDGESDAPVHSVYVSAFYVDQTDVAYSLWQQVYNWAITNGYSFDNPGSGKAANHPVQAVNWYDCVKWCNARSEMEGRVPAYYTGGTQTTVYRTGDIALTNGSVNWGAGYRLPTEAEWEKAARGGLNGQRFPWGGTISWSQANYYGKPGSQGGSSYDLAWTTGYDPTFALGNSPYTSPVGYFAPNGYRLYDMAGNVCQWIWDWYGTYGSGGDPHGPTSGTNRMIRGGSFNLFAFGCRTAFRSDYSQAYGSYFIGFRSVLAPAQ